MLILFCGFFLESVKLIFLKWLSYFVRKTFSWKKILFILFREVVFVMFGNVFGFVDLLENDVYFLFFISIYSIKDFEKSFKEVFVDVLWKLFILGELEFWVNIFFISY